MNRTELLFALILVTGVFIGSVSQVLLKKSAGKEHKSVIREYLNPLVIAAYSMFVISTVLSMVAYKVIPLSLGALLDSLGYFFITFFGIFLFGEKMNARKAVSLVIIVIGIVIYSV